MGLCASTKERTVARSIGANKPGQGFIPLEASQSRAGVGKSLKGFTIIEVLIVLAIAGLIILIVLLAVPALQRGNRNSSRKKDVTRLAGAVTNFLANKNYTPPSTTADAYTILIDAGKLGQYNLAAASPVSMAANNQLSIVAAGSGTPAALSTGLIDAVQIVTSGVCSSSQDGSATNVGANSHSIAIQYTLETGTGNTSQPICQNS